MDNKVFCYALKAQYWQAYFHVFFPFLLRFCKEPFVFHSCLSFTPIMQLVALGCLISFMKNMNNFHMQLGFRLVDTGKGGS